MKRTVPGILLCIALFAAGVHASGDPLFSRRDEMVRQQIEKRGVKDNSTLDAMRKVERHKFVPNNLQDRAYADTPLPIGFGQTISQPYIVAYMTEVLRVGPQHRVLEIGTGSGYQAAVLAEIVEKVCSVEIIPELGKQADRRLQDLGYANVDLKIADGYFGWEEMAPFDAIIVTAAAEFVPPPLISQLKDGGKMVIPIGSPFMLQYLVLVEKKGETVKTTSLMPVRFVPLRRSR